ncbi:MULTISPECIES: TonB family protein [unclassified Pseudomonas]|uniref:energy transducer TonB n=1 Tax=unclassified Pseudomonas TaxID=196821 RepID=UPI002447E119|nr:MULTISPECIES: TonB family protein [unclassified Pseudomonas]MDG9922030.1 TonB family protein [Pseudomonas sp. GD04045]MDH0033877.1 TonB family protein [Pseudomonas sp. GD04019]
MSRYALYFMLSLGLHAGVGWLLRDVPVAAGSKVVSEAPVTIQLVELVPLEQIERHGSVAQPVVEARREPPAKAAPQDVEPKAPVVSQTARLAAKPVARPAPSETVAAKGPATPAPVTPRNEPSRPVESVRQVSRPSAVPAPKREVFRHEPAFLSPPRPPVYPAQAKRRNQQGVVLVEVRLDEYGKLVELKLLRSSGVESLDRSAMKAVAAWRFRAEVENGQPVPSRVHIPIEFALTASR